MRGTRTGLALGPSTRILTTRNFLLNLHTPILSFYSTMSNFQSIIEALDRYTAQTGINLRENPLADRVTACDSPDAVLLLLQDSLKAFKEYRDKNRKFLDRLRPVVKFVHIFSGVLGEATRMVSRYGPCRT